MAQSQRVDLHHISREKEDPHLRFFDDMIILSKNIWEHNLAILWVLSKIFEVPIVLVNTPNHHLNGSNNQEDKRAGMSALNAEEKPSEKLPPIISTANPFEAPTMRNTSLCCPWLSQVPQSQMSLQVQVLKKDEEYYNGCHEFLAFCPFRGTIFGVQEEVHVNESEYNPVVEAILEKVKDWHGIIGETMHKQCLELTFEIVTENKSQTNLLIHS